MAIENRYSHHVRRALHHAETLAHQYGHARQDTAHLLVGVMMTEGSLGARVLEIFDLPVPVARVYLKRMMSPHEHVPVPTPHDDSFDKALEEAASEADWLNSHYIGTEHLLLGITRTNVGNAINLLKLVDITPEQLRRRVRHVISDGQAEFSLETVRANAKISELSRRVLNAAEQRAVALDHPAVGIGHLLWALVNERRGVTSKFLKQSGINHLNLIQALDNRQPHLFISIETVLDEAITQAEKFGSHYVGADHLLLALASMSVGSAIMVQFEAAPEKIVRLLNKHLKE
jgi:ATP-dependent Clp protease ATP-binding subunit ClpA